MRPIEILPTYAEEIKATSGIQVLEKNQEYMRYQIDGVDGSGTVEVYTLFPGIVLQFHSFQCKTFFLGESKELGNSLKINYCSGGRMETKMSDQLYLYMKPGILSLDTRKAQNTFHFPCGHYHGVEILIHMSAVEQENTEIWKLCNLDVKKIWGRFCGNQQSYAICEDEKIRQLFVEIMAPPLEYPLDYLRVKIIELFLFLQNASLPEKNELTSFMTVGQVAIAKEIMETITADLSRHISIESLAREYGLSPSSLKNYFEGVYGENISTYLRELRMSTAAKALAETSSAVSEIAASVGYENASKFSAAFKKIYGDTPLEYRRLSHIGL